MLPPCLCARATARSSATWHGCRACRPGWGTGHRMILLAANRVPNAEIARVTGVSRPTVIAWRERYESGGSPRWGTPRAAAARPRSTRSRSSARPGGQRPAAAAAGDHALVGPVPGRRARHLLRDRRPDLAQVAHPAPPARTFKFSTDPQLEAKMRDVVGLYLAPPDNAVVVSVDEKSQIQALDRTAPMLPLRPGLAERAHPRLQAPRNHHPVRRPRGRHRRRSPRAPATRATATRSS